MSELPYPNSFPTVLVPWYPGDSNRPLGLVTPRRDGEIG